MILPALYQSLAFRVTTPVWLSEEEETTTSSSSNNSSDDEDEKSSSRGEVSKSNNNASFPDSDLPPSRCFNYSVGPLAHVKSQGRDDTDNESEAVWELSDFTMTSVTSDDDNDSTSSMTASSSYLGSGKFGTVQLYKERSSNRKVALKSLSKRNNNARKCLLWKREVEIQTR